MDRVNAPILIGVKFVVGEYCVEALVELGIELLAFRDVEVFLFQDDFNGLFEV